MLYDVITSNLIPSKLRLRILDITLSLNVANAWPFLNAGGCLGIYQLLLQELHSNKLMHLEE
jgi:hypothetical protein